jgi:hypothetical protein
MKMIRKQLYVGPEQQRKLRLLAKRWKCTEAEVMRAAIDRLPDIESAADARLREAGLLVDLPDDPDLPPPEKVEELEREWDEWLRKRGKPIGLVDAVLEDRR